MGSEQRRHQLYEELRQVFSEGSADELMGSLPPVAWSDLATKGDVAALGTALRTGVDAQGTASRAELSVLRAELRGEVAELRGEVGAFRAELRGEVAELRGEVGAFRAELGQELAGVASRTDVLGHELRQELVGVASKTDVLGHELRQEMAEGFQALGQFVFKAVVTVVLTMTTIMVAAIFGALQLAG